MVTVDYDKPGRCECSAIARACWIIELNLVLWVLPSELAASSTDDNPNTLSLVGDNEVIFFGDRNRCEESC